MKFLNKIFLIGAIFFVSSCSLTDFDQLDNPNAVTPENAEAGLYLNAIQLNLSNFVANTNASTSRVMRQLAMTGGNVYNNAFAATSFNGLWRLAYAELLPDLDNLITLSQSEGSTVPMYTGIAKTIKAYVLMNLVDMFGDVPYTEAGKGVANLSPGADGQESIYNAAFALLDEAIGHFNTEGPVITEDLFYGGNADKWIKFANTLKLKYYMNTGSAGGANAGSFGSEIAALAPNCIRETADDFQFQYGTERNSPNSRHGWYNDGYENGASIYQSNYFMWSLRFEKDPIVDPRVRYYFYRQDLSPKEEIDNFTLDCTELTPPLHYQNQPFCHVGDGYWGRDHGNDDGIPPDTDRRTVAGVYPCGGLFDSGQGAPATNGGTDGALGAGIDPIMLSSFTNFMLAEAALTRGTGGDAAAMLEMAIRQSIAKVMAFGADQAGDLAPTQEEVDAYVTYVMDNFNAADNAGKLNIVMKEFHIATWGNGKEAYDAYRRTGMPTGLQPTLEVDSGDFPRLMYYPADYLNLNANISDQRSLTEQVFWDKNPAGALK